MSLLPPSVHDALAARYGADLSAPPLTGGDVNQAALVTAGPEKLVVKWKTDAPPGLFDAEADGLRRLRAAGATHVPEALASDDSIEPSWLALEYLLTSRPTDPRRFALTLTALHREDYLGSQPQYNLWADTWPGLYHDRRLLPQIAPAYWTR